MSCTAHVENTGIRTKPQVHTRTCTCTSHAVRVTQYSTCTCNVHLDYITSQQRPSGQG